MDRGSARTSRRVGLRHQPGHHAERGGRRRRPHPGARLGPGRGLRSASACTGAGDAVSHARQSDRRLRHSPSRGSQPRRRDQQDADRVEPRLRRPASLFRARTPDAARRDRTRARSARRHHAAIWLPPAPFRTGPRAARCWTPEIIRKRSGAASATARSRNSSRAAMPRAPRDGSTASATPPWSSRACPTWATSPRC